MKRVSYLVLILSLLLIAITLFDSELFRITRSPLLAKEHKRVLYNLIKEAEKKGQPPISAVLLFDYTVVGEGYNTVNIDSNAAGHAEINAINDAIKKFGFDRFMQIGRDSLILISTLEPCPMCKGALEVYNIKNVQFIKGENLKAHLNDKYDEFLYQLRKKKISSEGFLDSLAAIDSQYRN